MKSSYTFLLIVAFASMVFGQAIDQAKMNKDIEVAENILATLMKQAGNSQFVIVGRDRDVEGKYLPDFGVVFNVSSSNLKVLYGKHSEKKNLDWSDGYSSSETLEEGDGNKELADVFKEFLADYGSLIRQLKASEKIMVKTENRFGGDRSFQVAIARTNKSVTSGVSAEVSKSDLSNFDKGNLSREQLLEKIKITEMEVNYAKEPQLEVFSSMLERLYEVDLTDTYYMARTPDYERMNNFGVTYYLKYYSSTVHDDNRYTLPTIDKKNVSKEERNKIVEEMYPKFLEGFKRNILEYGHILKNVDEDEMVVFNIKLTSCEGCKMPATIEVSTKKSVIDKYRQEQLNIDEALAQIKVKDVN